MGIAKQDKIELYMDIDKIAKLKEVVNDLRKSNSIESERIEDFLKLTVYIVLHEYDKNKKSLQEFYKQNQQNQVLVEEG